MTDDPSEARQARLDAELARNPDQPQLRFERATLLAQAGRSAEARSEYLAVLALDPQHFGALNDLGTLLHETDYRTAARRAYAEAVRHHPGNPIGHINLGNALLAADRLDEARSHYEKALALAPAHPDAHQGMANLLQQRGDGEAAARHRLLSARGRPVTRLPYRGAKPPCRVLLLLSAAGGNVQTRFMLDDTVFATSILMVEAFTPETLLPPHDVVFNAVGDADLCAAALVAAEAVLARTTAPVLNPPSRVRGTGRVEVARRLAGAPGVVAPGMMQVERAGIEAAARTLGFPLLLRSPGYHTGQFFEKVDDPSALASRAADLPGDALLLIAYLDARDSAGRSRKYRVMMIEGQLFPLHLAISAGWKVHYFTADMADRPEHRAEEAAFLADMPGVLGPRAMEALRAVERVLGLNYAGVDFSLNADGALLLFEANATMVAFPPPPAPIWDYRRAPVARILEAARAMVLRRGGAERKA